MTAFLRMFACLIVHLAAAGAWAEDWPQFGRDGTRNAVSPEKNPPTWWQVEERDDKGIVTQSPKNVLWATKLGSATYGDPIVVDDMLWIGTNNFDSKIKKQDASVLACLNRRTGTVLYRYVSPRLANRYVDWPFSSMACSPLIEGRRMWFTTNRAEVVCLDIDALRRGVGEPALLWKVDMRKELGVFSNGTPMNITRRCSIAGFQDWIYVITGNGVDSSSMEVPAPEAPSLVCFHKQTGKVVWTDNSPGKRILHGQWASPVVIEINGHAQVVAPQGDGWVRAFDARTGKLIWKFDSNSSGAKDGFTRRGAPNHFLATPVFAENRIYIGNGHHPENGGGPGWLYCLDPTKTGDISFELLDGPDKVKPNPNSGMIWRFGGPDGKTRKSRFSPTASNVAVHQGLVIALDFGGYVHCLDSRTGHEYWAQDTRDGILNSPLIVDGKIYVSTYGSLWIFHLAKEKKVLAEIEMPGESWCSPIFAHGTLYVARRDILYAIAGDAKAPAESAGGLWNQWRGPDRTNIAQETGLLKTWPKEGPPLAWKAEGLGTGPMCLSVARGRIFALGYRDERENLNALDEASGKILWSAPIGPASKGNSIMQWLSQRSPTVDGERVYAVGVGGQLVCLEIDGGKELWRKDYQKDFDGKSGPWGFCDYPLVDSDKLICTPGGDKATIIALNKRTGAVLWQCAVPKEGRSTYGAIVATDIAGKRIYIHQLQNGVVGIAAADGKILWRHEKAKDSRGNVHTGIVRDDQVFYSCGWATGCGLLKLSPPPNEGKPEEIYYAKVSLDSWLGSSVLLGDHVHTSCGKCIEFQTGKVLHDLKLFRSTMTSAEGLLYHRTGKNLMLLHESTPQGYINRGRFEVPRFQNTMAPTWSFPVIAAGKLYLRDQDVLLCYDITAKNNRPRQPDAIFVPTPQDVVEKMLDLAGVKKTDLVVDLGCGDGRIVVTAAKKYGCRAAGYDLDPECVRLARASVQKEKVDKLVTIENKDIFTLDLSGVDVVTLYLLPKLNTKLVPQLAKLKPGARIVSHYFPIEGIRPEGTVRFVSAEDGVEHTLYRWTTPLKKEK